MHVGRLRQLELHSGVAGRGLCPEAWLVRTSASTRRSCARPRRRRDLTLISEMARILAVSEMLKDADRGERQLRDDQQTNV